MNRYVPDTAISQKRDLQYGDGSAGSDTTLDVFRPAGESGPLPTVVWVHGGAWISGSKANVEPYLRIIAGHGYTTVGVNYTLGPEAAYPTAVVQLNQALAYLDSHAAELGIDANQIVLAGDSAGSQLASQLAAMSTNPQYAELLGITPALSGDQLAATILNCGVYDMTAMSRIPGLIGWGFQVSLWAYTGTQDWSVGPAGSTMSTEQFVTSDFPETFLSGGNGDGLTWMESVPMYETLERAGVDVTTVFWPEGHNPELPHEYQFHLHYPEARHALTETLAFLDRVTVHG
jgi:acetyl esterase/lipase